MSEVAQLPGIISLSAEAYHADPCERPSLSASIAYILCSQSPLHAWTAHPKLNPDFRERREDRFDLGTVAHSLLLEGRELEDAVVIVNAKDWRTNAAKDEREAARAAGKVALLAHTVESVAAMLTATRRQLAAVNAEPPLLTDGQPEQSLIWEEDGILCRALLDWLRNDYSAIDDFKTTSASANPEVWTRRTLFGIGADIQSAFYLRGLKAITGIDAIMRYIVQETFPPYALSVVSLGPDVLAVADAKVDYAINRWRECLASNEWPAFPTEVCYAELPAWEEARWLEKEGREAV
jgi:hypothetical protein